MSTLSLKQLRKQFGDVIAVHEINLEVGDGEFLCILGPSGCGKSTALRMIAGFEDPTSGDILIDGQSVVTMAANNRPTAMVFQKYTLWPHMKVYDNIAFGLKLRGLARTEIDRKVNEALALVGLPDYGQRMPNQLSGGEQQRIALARALVLEPKILLLDEPFSNLDALLRVRLREELRRIQRRVKITAIFVTHDQEEALSLADRIAVMSKGRVEQLDIPSRIYDQPATLFVADFIGVMNLIPAQQNGATIDLGALRLESPARENGSVTVAIRPEDIAIVGETDVDAWGGEVEQIIDLGHYRKLLVKVPSVGTVKVYAPKALDLRENQHIGLNPSRFTIFREGAAPIEVKREAVVPLEMSLAV
jgi:putative spermidine/putrescine transport system ATP-binding protein